MPKPQQAVNAKYITDNQKAFINNLKHLMDSANMTAYGLAYELDCSKSYAYNLLSGTSHPSLDVIVRCAEVFNVTADYVMGIDIEGISPDESLLIKNYRKLTDSQKAKALSILELIGTDL